MTQLHLPIPADLLAPLIEDLDVPCCEGYVHGGPERCYCWTPILDPPPAPPVEGLADTMPDRCGDCAYRPDSPERRGVETASADWSKLVELAATGTPFWCHDGLPKVVGWTHPRLPDLVVPVPPDVDDYQPTIRDGIPHRADGRPGSRCAGWEAERRRHTRLQETTNP